MKVAVDITNKKIVDILPEHANSTNKFIIKNKYEVLDISDPILDKKITEDGIVHLVFRELTNADISTFINKDIINEIEKLELSLNRSYRELLSTTTSQDTKDIAQQKINDVELQIQELRSRMV